jgi:choloylglycine hydrolase
MKIVTRWVFLLAIAAIAANAPSTSIGCTGITLRPKDGSVIFARTLEFASDLKSNVIIIPRDMAFVGTALGDKPGLHWTGKYGIVGMNAFGLPAIADGLNEKGLHIGVFYFPGFAKYQAVTEQDVPRTLAPQELAGYLLGTCATADEAVEAAKNVKVAEIVFKEFGFVLPVHFIVTDNTGKSAVLEYVGGELRTYRNPLGVMSNSPTFDWHMINLGNYVNLSVSNVPKLDLTGNQVKGLGQGSGMLGLPGDFTPPSRFVRAVAFSQSALPAASAKDGVVQAFHILNQFDIPKGAARGMENGEAVADYTLWTSTSDLTNCRYYFRTFSNSRIRVVNLKTVDFTAKEVKTISCAGEEQIEDVSHATE